MKKYLMTALAAVALGAAFVSCSHSEDLSGGDTPAPKPNPVSEQRAVELAKSEYANLFEKKFGGNIGIGKNVDWGFGSNASTRAFTRGFTPTHLSSNSSWTGWISAPAASDYATEIPEGALSIDQYYANNSTLKNYYLKDQENTQEINCWVGNANIYINGKKSVEFKAPGDGNDNFNYYILPGADVTFTKDYAYNAPHHTMYVAATAKVTFKGKMSANIKLYNKGTVDIEGVTGPYAYGAIYNDGGTINCKKGLDVYNENSQVINNGTISVTGDVTVQGSGHFRNADNGRITATGETLVNSNDCSWINDGEYTTKTFTYKAGSTDVINNCMLKVNNEFYMNLGDTDRNCFLMNGGAGVEAGSFHFAGPGFIYMGSGSVFKVLGNAKLDATKANYGIYGPTTGESAVFHVVGNITTSNTAQAYDITYGNKIAVVATNHFDSETGYTSKSGTYPIIDFSNCTKDIIYTAGSKPSINIASGKCNPGFEGGSDPVTYRVIAEDLNANESGSDWDFNDVVFDVIPDENPQNGYTIRLLAAGGIYKLTVAGEEVHAKFGHGDYENGKYPMINTRTNGSITVDATPEWHVSSAFNGVSTVNAIEVIVYKPEYETLGAKLEAPTGMAASKVLVDNTYNYLNERTDILTVYPAFEQYVQGTFVGSRPGQKWWQN